VDEIRDELEGPKTPGTGVAPRRVRRPLEKGPVEIEGRTTLPPARQDLTHPPIVQTWTELRGVWRAFASIEWILRDRAGFFSELRERRDLGTKLRSMVVSSAIFFALYGLVMGIPNSWQQALMSAIKLPSLFLITLLVCLLTLYFFNLLFGSQLTFRQTAALIMMAINVTAALALSFASITLTFWLTSLNYGSFVLLNVGVLALVGWWGLDFLIQGMRFVQRGYLGVSQRRVLVFWILTYMFLGTHMAWSLRPFIGAPGQPFVLLRHTEGDFYSSVYHLLVKLLGL